MIGRLRRLLGLARAHPPVRHAAGEATVRLATELAEAFGDQSPPPLVARRLERFLGASAAERTAALPAFYLFVEQYLADLGGPDAVGRTALRTRVRADYPELLADPRFAIVFQPAEQQEVSLRREFLLDVHRRAVVVLGTGGGGVFQDRLTWLRAGPTPDAGAELAASVARPPPTGPADWRELLDAVSRDTYRRLTPVLGTRASTLTFEDAYQSVAADFLGLEGFPGVVNALPEELVDEEKVHVLSKSQMSRLLLDKVRHLETVNDILIERNEALDEARREAVRARDEAEMANRAKSDFLSRMSHELRTPLNSVIGFTNVLLKRTELSRKDRGYLERIYGNGVHLLELVNDILDLAKVEAGGLEPSRSAVDTVALVRETISELEPRVPDGVALTWTAPQALEPLHTDRMMLKRVLINLVGNALKFTEAGSVHVTLHPGPDGKPVRLDVADTGAGIAEDMVQRMFEPFRQGEEGRARRWDGTGLGLAISRSLCGLLGYRLDCESEVGRGSVFWVDFRPPEPERPPRRSAAMRRPGHR